MKKLTMMLALACVAGAVTAGESPKVYPVNVVAAGISTNTSYMAITDGAGWREIDRVVVLGAPSVKDAGTVSFGLAETDPTGVTVVYTEQIATSGSISNSATYANRPRITNVQAGVTNITERYSGRLAYVKVIQSGTGTNTWPCLIYAK